MSEEDKSKLQLIGEIAEANNKNLELIEEINKLYEVLDKIKELAKENTDTSWMRPEVIEGSMIFKNGLALEILELLEEIE